MDRSERLQFYGLCVFVLHVPVQCLIQVCKNKTLRPGARGEGEWKNKRHIKRREGGREREPQRNRKGGEREGKSPPLSSQLLVYR